MVTTRTELNSLVLLIQRLLDAELLLDAAGEALLTETDAALRFFEAGDTETARRHVRQVARYTEALVGNGKDNYWYWNAGVTLGFGDNFSLDFRYWDTNVSNTSNFCSGNVFQCDERFVGTAKVTF
jgi:acyl-homoserine lactone acylase PvdQ